MDDKGVVNQLTDVTVEKVGLVSMGANGELFFLLKSLNGDKELTMTMDNSVVVEQNADDFTHTVDDAVLHTTSEEKASFTQRIKNVLGIGADNHGDAVQEDIDPGDGAADNVADDVVSETDGNSLETNEDVFQKSDSGDGAVDNSEDSQDEETQPDFVEKINRLAQENAELTEQLESIKKALSEQEELTEKQEFVQKLGAFNCVPVDKGVLADHFYALYKQHGDETFGFWFSLVSALDKALSDAGMFTESGTTEKAATDVDELINKAIDERNFDELKKLMMSLDQDTAQKMITARRERIGKSRV